MNIEIPSKILRRIIADILIEEADELDKACNKMQEKELQELDRTLEYSASVGWEACGVRVLADDVLSGEISIREAVSLLSNAERNEAKKRCENWIREMQEKETER